MIPNLNFYQSLECGRRTFKTRLEIKVVAGHSHQTRSMKIVVAITLLRLSVYCGYCCFSDSYCDIILVQLLILCARKHGVYPINIS